MKKLYNVIDNLVASLAVSAILTMLYAVIITVSGLISLVPDWIIVWSIVAVMGITTIVLFILGQGKKGN
jgi:hypothetical protein